MTNLSYGTNVRLATWGNSYAKIGTLDGYCTPAQAEISRKRGEPEAWTTFAGTCLTTSKQYYADEARKYADAVVIADGETVDIDGNLYVVNVIKGNAGPYPRNSDPIHFKAA